MAIEQEGKVFCKAVHHENGRVITRRIHEMVVQSVDGHTYRITGRGLPDSIALYCGESKDGKHFAEVLCDPRLPRPRWFGWIQKPTIRDVFYLWLGFSIVLVLQIAVLDAAFTLLNR